MPEPITIWPLEDAKKYHVHSEGLAAWLCDNLDKSLPVYDFGCGLGRYVKALRDAGFEATGFEGTPGINQIAHTIVVERDIAKVLWPLSRREKKGTVVCLEVMEHLLPEQEAVAIHNIMRRCAGTLVLSWAIPNQSGHGHNNCRDGLYVQALVSQWDYRIDTFMTARARAAATANRTTGFFGNSLYVFKK